MHALLERLRDHWQAQNIEISGGANEEEVAAFEHKHGVSLPPLFREYVREINGMADADCDADHISFWPLGRIEQAAEVWKSNDAKDKLRFLFADFLISSHEYDIQFSPDASAPALVTLPTPKQVQLPFEEFLERYLVGDREVIYLVGH
jgi:cell wall assembly regulator SMI1